MHWKSTTSAPPVFCEPTRILNRLNVHNSYKSHPNRAKQVQSTDTHSFMSIVKYSFHSANSHKTLSNSALLGTFDTNRATSVEIMGQASLTPLGTVRLSLRNTLRRPPIPNFVHNGQNRRITARHSLTPSARLSVYLL